MKSFLVGIVLLVFPAFIAYPTEPASFPPPMGGAHAVSEGSLGPAFGFQGHPHIASNGEVAMAMWGDSKAESWGTRVSPIDANGNALDPIGTLINDGGSPEGIYWNGTEFVALTIDGSKRTRVRLSPEGEIIDSVVLGMPVGFGLGAVSDDGQRLLFVEWGGKRVAIADRHGEMGGAALALAPLPEGAVVRSWLAAERNGEFVVARFVSGASWPEPTFDLIADRINTAGELISSVDTRLPVEFDENYVMAGGSDGYLFVTQKWTEPAVIAYRLDEAGVFTGSSITLVPYDPDHRRTYYKPAVVRDGSRFLVVWHMSFNHGESEVRIAEIPDGATSATSQRLAIWPGITSRIAFCVRGTQRIVLVSVSVLNTISPPDLYSIRVEPSLTGGPPRLVAASRTAQKRVEAAAGGNGFGVVWVEDGPDNATHVYFRRFSCAAMPQGAAIEVDRIPVGTYSLPYVPSAIVSNGQVYLLLWYGSAGVRGRRVDASGSWIDAEAFPVPAGFVPTGVTAGTDEAGVASGSGLLRIRFKGEPIAGVTKGPGEYVYNAAIATNGEGYVVVWSEGYRGCNFTCAIDPFQLLAARFSADGTLLDPAPIVLEDRVGHPDLPSVAWAGDRYLVVWSGWEVIHGATVSPDGVVLEGNPASTLGIPLDERAHAGGMIPRVVAQGDSFVMITSAKYQHSTPVRIGALHGVRFRFDVPLRTVAELSRREIAERTHEEVPAAAAGSDGRLLVGWIGEGETDGAPRAFFQIFGEQQRRRPARP
ncbi:MAG: hypothetical protein ACYC7A_12740 [Thermoanaerobaculia bacterium]